MKIASKFKDYYDGLQDPTDTLVYRRVEEELEVRPKGLNKIVDIYNRMPGNPEAHIGSWYYRRFTTDQEAIELDGFLRPSLIICCGKLYPSYKLNLEYNINSHLDKARIVKVYENLIEAYESILDLPDRTEDKAFDDKLKLAKNAARFRASDKENGSSNHRGYTDAWRPNPKGWLGFRKETQEFRVEDQVFRELNCPLFMLSLKLGKVVVTLNPKLSDTSMPKIIPAWNIYQELDMFLGNNMAKQEERGFTGSDEIRRDQHGFDEWSFKQYTPGQKKLKRKANKLKKKNKS